MYCPFCNSTIDARSVFCASCGNRIRFPKARATETQDSIPPHTDSITPAGEFAKTAADPLSIPGRIPVLPRRVVSTRKNRLPAFILAAFMLLALLVATALLDDLYYTADLPDVQIEERIVLWPTATAGVAPGTIWGESDGANKVFRKSRKIIFNV